MHIDLVCQKSTLGVIPKAPSTLLGFCLLRWGLTLTWSLPRHLGQVTWLVKPRGPQIFLSLPPHPGITSVCCNAWLPLWILEITLRLSCLCGKHLTHWAIAWALSPFLHLTAVLLSIILLWKLPFLLVTLVWCLECTKELKRMLVCAAIWGWGNQRAMHKQTEGEAWDRNKHWVFPLRD